MANFGPDAYKEYGAHARRRASPRRLRRNSPTRCDKLRPRRTRSSLMESSSGRSSDGCIPTGADTGPISTHPEHAPLKRRMQLV